MNKKIMLIAAVVASASLVIASPLAGRLSERMQKAEVERVKAGTDLQTLKVGQTTQFGERFLKTLKDNNVKLHCPEEVIKRLKAAKVPALEVAAEYADLEFSGSLQYNDFQDGRMELDYGFYRFGAKSGWRRSVMAHLDHALNGRGAYVNHKLCGSSSISVPYYGGSNWKYVEYDADLWVPTERHCISSANSRQGFVTLGACQNPVDGKVYGYMRGETPGQNCFCIINYENLTRSVISYTYDTVMAFAINSNGDGYCIIFDENEWDGVLNKVDLETGALTKIGYLGVPVMEALQSMTFDKQDRLFFCVSSVDFDTEEMLGVILDVDVETGAGKVVAYLPENEEYTVLNVIEPISETAPADIDNLTLEFDGTTTNGKVNFTVPTVKRDGSTLSGNVEYVLTINDNDKNPITGVAEAGSSVSVEVTAPTEGRSKAVVVLKADGLQGKRNAVINYAGVDAPVVNNAKVAYNGGSKLATVTWDLGGRFNGYVDANEVKYDVVRYPGGEKVASKIKDYTFSETLDHTELPYDAYYYQIIPFVGQTEYAPVLTNRIILGKPYSVPFVETFDTNEAFYKYTVLDMNGDGVLQDEPYDRVSRSTWGWEPYWDNCVTYRYSKENKAYDYLMTPPIHVEKDIAYNLQFRVACVRDAWPEKLSVIVCRGEDPESETAVTIMDETIISNPMAQPRWIELEYQSAQSGDIRIAFLCTSEPQMNELFLDDISLTSGQATKAPASATNVVVTPAQRGILEADIEFDAPSKTIGGEVLESIDKIEIFRGENGPVVATLTQVEPGAHYKVTDKDAVNGHTTYYVFATNQTGNGIAATASAYIGIDSPVAPINVKLTDNLDGTATLSWEATELGQNGGFVDTDELWFDIVTVSNNELVRAMRDVTGYSCTIKGASKTGATGALYYGVIAVNDAGESDYALAVPLVTGKPYKMPINENFMPGNFAMSWLNRTTDASCTWGIYRMEGMTPDGDDFMMGIEAGHSGETAWINTSKINLAGEGKPMLVFYTYAINGADNVLNVYVDRNGQQNGQLVCTVDGNNITEPKFEEGWMLKMIDLSSFLDAEYIVITFEAKADDDQLPFIFLDDISICDVFDKNLETNTEAYTRTTAGEKAEISAIVRNTGLNAMGNYRVNFHVNGEIVTTLEATGLLNPFDRATYTYQYITKVSDPAVSKVWTSVECDDDEVAKDNVSEKHNLAIYASSLNTVPSLTAVLDNDDVKLNWEAPEKENKVVESFEGYNTFAREFGRWTLIDGDKAPTASLNGIVFPGMNKPMAFMTFDFSEAGLDLRQYPDFTGNTGNQFAMAFKAQNVSRNDDWMISPELNGKEQIVTVYAKSLAGAYSETFELLYSTTGTAKADFNGNVIGSKTAPTDYFGRFNFVVPEGAKYFAIHCNSVNGGLFLVDDVTYYGKDLEVLSYNIYRDDELIANVPASQTDFVETSKTIPAGQHRYNVTAIYDEGQSGYSDPALVATTGLFELNADALSNVSGHKGFIRIAGARGETVLVHDTLGRVIYKAEGSDTMTITAFQGVYIVSVGNKATKVIVK